MNQTIRKHRKQSLWRPLVAVGMMLLLVWLTSINFLYATVNDSASQTLAACMDGAEDSEDCNMPNSPTGPDEKSPDAPATSFLEEFIHDHPHTVNPLWINMMFQHKVHEAEKLSVVHGEIFLPPPEA